MPYVVVDNFSGGLDSRRHVLNSKSGTLSELVNAHITRGGEIEKRKAFVQDVDLMTIGVETFGMEATSDGVFVFGQAEAPASMPSGYLYQRLQHPIDPTGANFKLIGVVFSTVYGGKPFVIAEFGVYPHWTADHRIAYYDGVAIKDWYEGVGFAFEAGTDFAYKLADYINAGGKYVASATTSSGVYIDITGPSGKSFTPSTSVNIPGITSTITVTQPHKDAIPETLSKGSFSITGGKITAAKIYQTGRNLGASGLPGIRSIRVGASSLTAADGADLIGWGGVNGLKYNTYSPPYTTGSDCGSLYYNIAKAINDNTTSGLAHGYSAVSYRRCQNGGNDTNDLIIYAPASEGSTPNGLVVQIEFDADPTGVYVLSEFINTATIAASPYDPSRFIATYGSLSGGSFNRVISVTVDGIEVLGSPVSWETSHGATAAAIAAQINAFTSSVEYSASVTDGSRVVLTGSPGTGKVPNGRVIEVETEGSIVVSSISSFSGGVDMVPEVPQISRINYLFDPSWTGTQPGNKYSVTIIDPENPAVPLIYGASRVAGLSGNFAVTYKAKEYLGVDSTLYFSAVNDATKWDIYDIGSGFIDMSNNFGGREDLTGVGVYQNRLAVFSRRNVQLWGMDADPAQNTQVQVLANTGSIAPDSIVSVGSIDLLYLADNGVRSVRARESTDTAYASDIGSPVDSIIIDWMAGLTEIQKYKAKAVIEPIDGRYWLSLGNKIFVLSAFQGSNIVAWSIYEPGFSVEEMVSREDRVYVRSGNKIYVYGGADGATYDDCEVIVELPYLDANKPATYKEAKGIDATIQGTWQISMGFDHTNPEARDVLATPTQPTFALGKIPATGFGTHFGLRLTNQSAGYARLANVIVHYDEMHSKHDAG